METSSDRTLRAAHSDEGLQPLFSAFCNIVMENSTLVIYNEQNLLAQRSRCWKALQHMEITTETTINQNELWSTVPKDTSTHTLVPKARGTLKKREQRDYRKNQRIRE